MWLENQALIKRLETGEIDYRTLMQNNDNKTKTYVCETSNKFDKPDYLEERIKEVLDRIKVQSERSQKDKEYFMAKVQDTKERVDEAVDFAQRLLANGRYKSNK